MFPSHSAHDNCGVARFAPLSTSDPWGVASVPHEGGQPPRCLKVKTRSCHVLSRASWSPPRNACARSSFSPEPRHTVIIFSTLSHAISECESPVEQQLFPAPSAPASAIRLEHQPCRRPYCGRLRRYSVPSGWSEPSAASSVAFITRSRIEPGISMASQHNWHIHDPVIVPRDLANIDLHGGRLENIIELSRDVCGFINCSMLADRLYSEVACVSPTRPTTAWNLRHPTLCSSSVPPCGSPTQRVALRRNCSEPRLARVKHFSWCMHQCLQRDQSSRRGGTRQLWHPAPLCLPRIHALQHVTIGNALIVVFSAVITENALRHALANPWVQIGPTCELSGAPRQRGTV